MSRFALAVFVTFGLGFAIAWSCKPVNPISGETPISKPAARIPTRKPHAAAPFQSAAKERVKGYMGKFDEEFAKKTHYPEYYKSVPVGDIPLLVEQWTKRAGFSGLGQDEQNQITLMAMNWFEKDPQAALDWAAGMECQKEGQELISRMVGAEAARDFDHAIELARQYGKAESGGFEIPEAVLKKLGQFDPARFMEIMQLFSPRSSRRGGPSYYSEDVDFKENFDFAGLAAMLETPDGESKKANYSYVPYNFVKEWASLDPKATLDWISRANDDQMPHTYWVNDFFSVLAASRSKEQFNDFVMDELASRTDDESKFKLAWQALSTKPDAVQIADFIDRIPGDRSANLEQFVKWSTRGGGGHFDDFRDILMADMTRQERMLILPKVYGFAENRREAISENLRKLGHSDAEIDAMLPYRRNR